jgi:hypothetical protein
MPECTAAHTRPAPDVTAAGLVGCQEDAAEPPADRAARRRGQRLLEALAGLQLATLGGSGASESLARLAALAADPPEAASPGLRAALRGITLRARIEAARGE